MLIVDSHQDLAWNMLAFGRDYTRSAEETRRVERGGLAPQVNGDTLLGWPDYQKGCVAVVFATLFAAPMRRKLGDWDTLCYSDEIQAQRLYRAQLEAYYRLVDSHPDYFRLIQVRRDLKEVLDHWNDQDQHKHPVGLVALMEGAEGVREPEELEIWWRAGVRLIGPAWAGTRYSGGTREPGPLTQDGYALLDGMATLGFILDLSHMDEKAALQALDHYPGQVVATHANVSALLKGSQSNRHLSDRVIQGLLEHGGIIGVVPHNSFLKVGWSRREEVSLTHVTAHIDYICQMAGNAQQVGLGTDFDGGFGWQSVPDGIDSIADLPKLAALLTEDGYSVEDVAAIMGQNWLSLLRRGLPEEV
jgi:membrane dipeptidase